MNQPSYNLSNEKPGKVQAIMIMTLVNGILNILYGLVVTLLVVIGTLGIGLLCAPLTILPVILGIFEILAAVKLLSTPVRKPAGFQTLAILEIISIITGNFLSMVVGILNLIFLSDIEVKNYLNKLPS
jgi:hypothetical protein